ncbi:ribosomal protein S3 (mitochondrion) [Madurella fahalii]|uniref:Ribosomal protein S3 n=1 Tax=Madurella fahalii TaxID=1157608 RepID=A0ABN7CJW0_9PEZI
MNNKTKKFLDIFSKYIKNNNKIIPFKAITSDVGKTKYFPPISKEWKNSIYVFNQNNLKNLPIYDININLLIKNFFNLYFNSKFILKKYISYRLRSKSFNKIYASKAEIKHTNNKAILTVYVYNREKISLYKKIRLLRKSFYNKIKLLIYKNKEIFEFNGEDSNNMYNKSIKVLLYKNIKLLRKYKFRLNLNKYKFEEKLLYKLKNFIVKFYNKKVEFNIVNLRSVVFHSDFFTKILTSKLKNRKVNILKTMDTILNKVVLPKVNRIVERSSLIRTKDLNLLENKYKYMNLSFILKSKNLSDLLNNLYNNIIIDYYNNNLLKKNYKKIYEIIFNSINYKNMGGMRLEAKGRLTKRYRADRAIFKVRWKGGLKNIDSSYKGLSSVNMRGYLKPNVDYSIFTSKRRIGAFAVKGWISGK